MKFKIFLFSNFLFLHSLVQACGWWPTLEEYRFGLFSPFNAYHKEFYGLSFTSEYYQDRSNSFGIEHDRNLNIEEWQKLSGAEKKDIDFIIYHSDPAAFDRESEFNQRYSDNTFLKWLNQRPEYLEYFRAAKSTEVIYSIYMDPWEEDIRDDFEANGNLPRIVQMDAMPDENLKKRYAFLAIKEAFYMGNPEKTIMVYEHFFKGKTPTSIIDYWAKYYSACHYLSLGKNEEAHLLFSEVFVHSADKRIAALEKSSQEELSELLQKTINPVDKYNIRCLMAAKSPRLCTDLLEQIAAFDIHSPMTEFLFYREIAKYEDLIFTEKISGFPSFGSESRTNYYYVEKKGDPELEKKLIREELTQFLNLLIKIQRKNSTDYWKLALIHTEVLAGKTEFTFEENQFYSNNSDNPLFLQMQITLWMTNSLTKNAGANEGLNKAVMIIDYINHHLELGQNSFIKDRILAWQFYIFHHKGMKAHAALTLNRLCNFSLYYPISEWTPAWGDYGKRYLMAEGTEETAKNMLLLLQSKNTSDKGLNFLLEEVRRNPVERMIMLDYTGSLMMRYGKYQSALNAWKEIPKPYWKNENYSYYLASDPFRVDPGDMHRSGNLKHPLSKPKIARELLRLEEEILSADSTKILKALKRKAAYAFNTTYYGNSWIMNKMSWSNYELMENNSFGINYYTCQEADSLFQLYYSLSPQKEEKAFAAFMLARCEKNKWYFQHYHRGGETEDSFYYQKSKWVNVIRKHHENSAFAQSLYSSCWGREAYWKNFSQWIP